jgi:hypothetical protein
LRDAGDDHRAARLGDAVHQLDGRLRQSRRIADLGERDQRARHLCCDVEPLAGVDANSQPSDQCVELARRQRAQNVRQPEGCRFGNYAGRHWLTSLVRETRSEPRVYHPDLESGKRMKLVWKGRTWEPGAFPSALAHAAHVAQTGRTLGAPVRHFARGVAVQILEQVGDPRENRLIHGDVLEVARQRG